MFGAVIGSSDTRPSHKLRLSKAACGAVCTYYYCLLLTSLFRLSRTVLDALVDTLSFFLGKIESSPNHTEAKKVFISSSGV